MTEDSGASPKQFGQYDLIERVGIGGMGTVYRAIDRRTGGTVALKLLHEHLQLDSASLERFRREAHIASLLTSPYIVRVIEFGSSEGRYYMVSEFVEGTRLSDVLQQGRIEPAVALSIAAEVALALEAAAQRGIVHRDIKPDNLIYTPDRSTKVADFGVSRLTYAPGMTLPGTFVGTVAYAAPEQFRGQSDIRSDIYSLGVVLFQMLSGELPFHAETITSLIQMHERTPPPMNKLPELPAAVKKLVARCLEKQPRKRYQQPSELVTALEAAREQLIPRTEEETIVAGLPVIMRETREDAPAPRSEAPPAPEALPGTIAATHVSGSEGGGGHGRSKLLAGLESWRQHPLRLAAAAGGALLLALGLGLTFAMAGGGDNKPAKPTDQSRVLVLARTAQPTATLSPQPNPTASPTPRLPDRTDCNAIRGTDYRSEAERQWFLTNCVSSFPSNPGPSGGGALPSQPTPTPVPPPPPGAPNYIVAPRWGIYYKVGSNDCGFGDPVGTYSNEYVLYFRERGVIDNKILQGETLDIYDLDNSRYLASAQLNWPQVEFYLPLANANGSGSLRLLFQFNSPNNARAYQWQYYDTPNTCTIYWQDSHD
jgi:hypothetical protein